MIHTLMVIYTFAQAHWGAILITAATLSSMASTVEMWLGGRYPKAAKALEDFKDLMSWIPKAGHSGILGPVNLPFFPSFPKKKDE
jgi:hypothetical protein